MQFISVCSGIEAASVAWNPLGWKAAWFSEIERFPSAVLAHHYPDTPNLGDMTRFKDWPDATVDLLCGGTPCQSFSNAGFRAGLDDPRGQLMLTFGAIAARYRPRWLVWENVPGVLLSNGGRDFGAFLGLLGHLGYGFAYRVLDAQFVRVDGYGRAVPQRRQRVFVVGCLGDWRSAAAVLLERESLRGDPAPRRSSGARVAGALAPGAHPGGLNGQDAYSGQLVAGIDSQNVADTGNLCGTLMGEAQKKGGQAGHGVAYCLNAKGGGGRLDGESETLIPTNGGVFDVAHTLRGEGFDAGEDGTGRGTPLVPVGVTIHGTDGTASVASYSDVSSCLRARDPAGRRDNSTTTVVQQPVAFGWQNAAAQGMPVDTISPTLDKSKHPATATATAVRRLLPVECERLQGFPDGWTAIPWRGKPASECPDGPRYKAIGNSWAVNCARWIGMRIAMVDALRVERRHAA